MFFLPFFTGISEFVYILNVNYFVYIAFVFLQAIFFYSNGSFFLHFVCTHTALCMHVNIEVSF